MTTNNFVPLGIYEKALPLHASWPEKLDIAKQLGFDFVELSIDESDHRLERLQWNKTQRLNLIKAIFDSGIRIPSLCLSAHRRFPLGNEDNNIRHHALTIMQQAIEFAQDIGIRVIQLAGYDVYYQQSNESTRALFRDGLSQAVMMASQAQVMLAMEIMDYPLMNSISKALGYQQYLNSPWFTIYPDIGNLSAWDNDVTLELIAGLPHTVAVHVKDTRSGVFKNVPFGEGIVDFDHCFSLLNHHHYHGPYLIEMWSETAENPIAEIKKAATWVKNKMRNAGINVKI